MRQYLLRLKRKWQRFMPKLPIVSGVEIVKALSKLGYEIDHQTGSHMILRQIRSRTGG
jgi:predicted RNA binding protein YcfA (HicA-like mRNA interferase family)